MTITQELLAIGVAGVVIAPPPKSCVGSTSKCNTVIVVDIGPLVF